MTDNKEFEREIERESHIIQRIEDVPKRLQYYERKYSEWLNLIRSSFVDVIKLKFLDVGCDIGIFLSFVEKMGFVSYGVDPFRYNIDSAKTLCKNGIFHLDLAEDELPFPESFFDCISMLDVLEHIERTDITLSHICKYLKSSGNIVYINTQWKLGI